MFLTFNNIFLKKEYRKIFVSFNIIFILMYFIFSNIYLAIDSFYLYFFSFSERLKIFLLTVFDISELRDPIRLLLLILLSISLSLFFLFIYILFKDTRQVSLKKTLLGSLGAFLAILGLSCVACGFGLLFSVLSFFGISSLALYFPLHGVEFGFLGLIFLNIGNYFLLKRIKSPFVC